MGFGHVPESPAGAEVRYRVAGRDTLPLGSAEQVVGHGDEGILLDERLSVLADERETVHIGVYAYSEIRAVLDHRLAQGSEVRGKRLRIMSELAAYLGVYGDAFHSEPFQQPRHYYGPDGVHGIQHYLEARRPYGIGVDRIEGEHRIDMFVGEVVVLHVSEAVHRGEVELSAFREIQNLLSLPCAEELSVASEQLEGVPLPGVMACGDDYPAVGSAHQHGELGRGRGRMAAAYDIHPASCERAAYQLLHHFSAYARVPADDDAVAPAVRGHRLPRGKRGAVGVCELDYIYGSEAFPAGASYGSAYSGNRFYQCHSLQSYEINYYICARLTTLV